MINQQVLTIPTTGRGLFEITPLIKSIVEKESVVTGICHLFLHHTSASLIIGENFDPTVLMDLETFMQRLAPDGDPDYKHTVEGPDDMPSHIRSILTQTFLCIPITENQLVLGRWQGIFVWEHRLNSYQRKLTVTLQG